jgi:hypothetical protein
LLLIGFGGSDRSVGSLMLMVMLAFSTSLAALLPLSYPLSMSLRTGSEDCACIGSLRFGRRAFKGTAVCRF